LKEAEKKLNDFIIQTKRHISDKLSLKKDVLEMSKAEFSKIKVILKNKNKHE